MKIIDLLNKIANGEEVPKKINYMGEVYLKTQYDDTQNFMIDYLSEESENAFFDTYNISAIINDEVEIIEEEPRDIEVCGSWFTKSEYDKLAHSEEEKKIPKKLEDYSLDKKGKYPIKPTIYEEILKDKINSIIDYLKSKGE